MESVRIGTREAIIYLTLIGIGIGLLFGLVPLIYGWKKGKTRLGLIGFITSIVAGAIWSVLPLLVMIVFVFLIARDKGTSTATGEPSNEPAADPPVSDIE